MIPVSLHVYQKFLDHWCGIPSICWQIPNHFILLTRSFSPIYYYNFLTGLSSFYYKAFLARIICHTTNILNQFCFWHVHGTRPPIHFHQIYSSAIAFLIKDKIWKPNSCLVLLKILYLSLWITDLSYRPDHLTCWIMTYHLSSSVTNLNLYCKSLILVNSWYLWSFFLTLLLFYFLIPVLSLLITYPTVSGTFISTAESLIFDCFRRFLIWSCCCQIGRASCRERV